MIQKLIPIIALEIIVLVALWLSNTIDQSLFAIGAVLISVISGMVVARSLRDSKP